ncbi:MAG: DMT family transporter [Bacillota bacterium]|nr:DMT family transporter [Bacillota bacterium]
MKEQKKKMLLADLGLLLAATFWGVGFVAGDMVAATFPAFWIMAFRFTGAGLILGILFRQRMRKATKADQRAGVLLGILLFIAQPFQIIGLKYTTPSKQAFLLAAYVVIVPFVSWLVLKKRPQAKAFPAGLMALCGIGLISLNGAAAVEMGDLLSIIFALLYSFTIVATGVFAKKADPIVMSCYQYLTTGGLSILASFLIEDMPRVLPKTAVIALVYLTAVNTVGAYTIQNVARRYTTDTHAAVLISTQSVIGYFCGVVLYGDPFTPRVLLGGLIVFGAVLLSVVNRGDALKGKTEG